MELRHLRCFVAVAEELHLARAAERLHIEQSPLSNEEDGHGARLHVCQFQTVSTEGFTPSNCAK
jgi:hypothetical protein